MLQHRNSKTVARIGLREKNILNLLCFALDLDSTRGKQELGKESKAFIHGKKLLRFASKNRKKKKPLYGLKFPRFAFAFGFDDVHL